MAKYYNQKNRAAFYNAQFEIQDGRCAVCGRKERLIIDHDHKSGHMRGLLCYKHNTAIGLLEEDLQLLENIKNYLTKHNETLNTFAKIWVDVKERRDKLEQLIQMLLLDKSFPSDRARARALAAQTGLLKDTAHTKIRRARLKLTTLEAASN